ncbi:MAG: hypothetical protein K0R14_2145 [Burkholderiales bacterium]|jgi:sugar lactone lactonase YvrE|nr:hypothetical protein [Burkholderiales bacterium]
MIKFFNVLLVLICGITIASCSDGGSSSTGGGSSKSLIRVEQTTGNWQIVGNSLSIPNVAFNSVVLSSNGTVYAGGSADVNNGLVIGNTGTSGDWQLVGNSYTPVVGGESSSMQVGALAVSSTNIIYAAVNLSYSQSVVMYSDPNKSAGTWQLAFPIAPPSNEIINSLAIDNTDTVYAATSAGYTLSADNQIHYIGNVYIINIGTPQQLIGRGSAPDKGVMNSVVAANGTVYAASGGYTIDSNGNATYFGDVYSADSAGTNAWKQIGGSGTPDNGVANSIALSNDKKSIYVATSNGNVYKSSVSSGVWSKALGRVQVPDGSAINSIAVANSGVVYVATALGNVYRATETSVWQPGGTVPDGWSINSIAVYGTQVYVATQGGHVYTQRM